MKTKTPQNNVRIMKNTTQCRNKSKNITNNVRVMKNTTAQCRNENKNTTKQCKNNEKHHKTM
jgi:hypothetical protein